MISPKIAHDIYTLLVVKCEARESLRADFVHHVSNRDNGEYRFQGMLGFGGKFFWGITRWTVSSYPEDNNVERQKVITETNAALQSIRSQPIMLTAAEIKFLQFLSVEGSAVCKANPPADSIQSLVDRGYCSLSPTLVGPLALKTGEVSVKLTDSGRESLASVS